MNGERRAASAEGVSQRLRERGLTVSVAESCTGGMLGAALTSVAGSSAYFMGGVIAYANEVKVRDLGVSPEVLAAEGAVSETVARQMACGVRVRFATDMGLAVTGIAGPGGGTTAKPVGTVCLAVARGDETRVRCFRFHGDRASVREQSCRAALEFLDAFLTEQT
jgi:PncC family amidohydrolase